MTLTSQDLQVLKSRFKAEQHEFLQGNAYITEAAITDRIEEIDPSWELHIRNIDPRPSEGETKGLIVTVHASLTIKGVTRDGVGMAVVSLKKDGKTEANEAEKAAATDAMKRAARLFGIGRYLLDLPDYVKDTQSMAKFLGSAPAKPAPATPKVVDKPQGSPQAEDKPKGGKWTAEEAERFSKVWQQEGYKAAEILEILGVKRLGEWQGDAWSANDTMAKAMAQGA